MASLKDIAKVATGVSLVAKEAIRRSGSESVIKAAVLSAADVAGITRGKLRSFEAQNPNTDNTNHTSSVIYFTDESPHEIPASVPEAVQTPIADANVPLPAPSASPDSDPLTSSDQGPRIGAASTSNASVVDGTVIPRSQRKPRERRVPTTPFSRAIG